LPLHDSPPAARLRPSKNHASTRFLTRLSRLVISRREITRLLPAPCKVIQFQLSDQLIPVSSAAPSRARETRCTENRRLLGTAIPPPALAPRCAGTSDDRPDLRADDWTAPCTAEPGAAAAIGSAVGSFVGAGAAMRSDGIARQQEQKN
jgi:type IV secretion system protein VirD4